MSRRKKRDTWDDTFDLLMVTPIWFGPVLAAIAYALLAYGAPQLVPVKPPGEVDVGVVLRRLFPMLAKIIPLGILLIWIVAELKRRSRGRRLDEQTGHESIRALTWPAFEELVCEAYRRRGYLAERLGGAGPDGGVDIRLTRSGETSFVQCKQWKVFKVGVRPVRELLGVVAAHGANTGILVTSGHFTPDAVRFAESNPKIQLIDGTELAALIASVQSNPRPTSASPPAPMHPPALPPRCPACGSPTVQKTAKHGRNAGSTFYGCSRFPHCKGIVAKT